MPDSSLEGFTEWVRIIHNEVSVEEHGEDADRVATMLFPSQRLLLGDLGRPNLKPMGLSLTAQPGFLILEFEEPKALTILCHAWVRAHAEAEGTARF
jgi:hypothetical protein